MPFPPGPPPDDPSLHERRPGHGPGFRHGWGSPVAGFTVPSVLLLLRGGERHGYALRDELESCGLIPDVDFGNLYRALRRMEAAGLVDSRWEVGGEGPGKRVYTLTADGEAYLRRAAEALRGVRATLDRFFDRFEAKGNEGR